MDSDKPFAGKTLGIPNWCWAVVSPLGVFGLHYVSAAGQWAMLS